MSGSRTTEKKTLMFIITLTSFFNAFMAAAINIAIPDIAKDFSMNASEISWVAMSFIISSAVFMVPFGKIADIHGRKRIFLIGNIIFVSSSLLCFFSTSGLSLIIYRLIQGIGSAMILSTATAIITTVFPRKHRGKQLGINISAVYLGLTAAPFIGGYLTQVIGWRSIFMMNFIAGIVVIVGLLLKVKSEWADSKGEKFDFKSSVIYVVSILLLMYGLSKLPESSAFIMVAAGIILFFVFIKIETKNENPVLDITLFTENKVFAFSNIAALINYAATFAITFVLSLYLQYAKGLKPGEAGLVLITQPAVMAFVAIVIGRITDKHDSRILASLGMAVIVVGLSLLYFLKTDTSNYYLIFCLAFIGAGFGLFTTPNTNAVMSSVESKKYGIASAILGSMRLMGQMISMAVAAMIINIFIGKNIISDDNIDLFMDGAKSIFLIFVALCFIGVFASLARGKTNSNIN